GPQICPQPLAAIVFIYLFFWRRGQVHKKVHNFQMDSLSMTKLCRKTHAQQWTAIHICDG
ncbi:hypothetical protein DVA81_18750, partial [Acinetobacter baumannii]